MLFTTSAYHISFFKLQLAFFDLKPIPLLSSSENCFLPFQCVPLYCAKCTASLVGLRVQMAVICVSVNRCHPNLASARLLNQINLEHVKRNAAMMMIVEETRSAAPMAVAMSVLPQNTKVCCSDISTY